MANIVDGTYDLVNDVVRAFRQSGVTREKVEAFQTVVQAVQDGTLTKEEAVEKSRLLTPAFAAIIEQVNKNAGAITVLLAIISLFIAIYAAASADNSSAQQHSDAEARLSATQSERDVEEKIYEQLEKMTEKSNSIPKNQSTGAYSCNKNKEIARAMKRKEASEKKKVIAVGECPPPRKRMKPRKNYQNRH